jgi:basic membrane lipoprotein Med (substrate-binding protein (PBP1-ABC) superfamily)
VIVMVCAALAAWGILGPSPAEAQKKLKVALCLPGAISDKGFNAAAHAGLMRIKDELGHEVAFTESVQRPDFVTALRDYAQRASTSSSPTASSGVTRSSASRRTSPTRSSSTRSVP